MLVAVGGSLLAVAMIAERAISSEPATHTVIIENMRFNPDKLTVKRGDRIVWVNKDLFPHTVSADAKAFDSEEIPAEKSWTYVGAVSGRYAYTCAYHPSMKGMLTVQ